MMKRARGSSSAAVTTMVSIKDVYFEPLIYPRVLHDGEPYWRPSERYKRAMEAGATLPPITLAKFKGRNYLVDGYNRLLAHKKLGREAIAAEFITCNSLDEIYEESLKRNTGHGANLSEYEIALAVQRLAEKGYDLGRISKIVSIPEIRLQKMIAERMVKKTDGSTVVLKRMFVGTSLQPDALTEEKQEFYRNQTQVELLQQLCMLIENNILDIDDEAVAENMEKLYKLLKQMHVR